MEQELNQSGSLEVSMESRFTESGMACPLCQAFRRDSKGRVSGALYKGKAGSGDMKIVIAGCGAIAGLHAKCIRNLSGEGKAAPEDADEEKAFTIAAVADIDENKALMMAEESGAAGYTDWEEMLDREKPDVVHICTPHYLHTPMAVGALARGVHVFMEKPPVISWDQWEQLKKAMTEAEGKARLGLCFQNRFHPGIQYMKKKLGQGTYGRILGARGIVTWNRDETYYTESGWRGKLEMEGGGALINQSIHTLDLLQYLIGEKPVSIEASTANHHLKGIIQVEDTMEAYITYPHASVCFYAATSYAANVPPVIELECEKARLRLEEQELTVFTKEGSIERKDFVLGEKWGKSYWGAGHMDCIRTFYESLEKGTEFPVELQDVEDTVWLMLSAYDSARA